MIGPLIDLKVRRTADALKKGAKIVNGGKRAAQFLRASSVDRNQRRTVLGRICPGRV
jgi:hypothetical protein